MINILTPHIDYLTVTQEYRQELPIVSEILGAHGSPEEFQFNKGVITCKPEYVTTRSKKHSGSFSSSLSIRCDGRKVTISGNPSRFNRSDNLFGYTSIDDCIQLYNDILEQYGLPPFTISTIRYLYQDKSNKESDRQKADHDGAKIQRVDITRNFATGSIENAYKVIRWLSGQRINGKLGHLYPNGLTTDWTNSDSQNKGSYTYLKYYGKFAEDFSDAPEEYRQKLQNFVITHGVVRQELSLKQKYLARNNINQIDTFRDENMIEILDRYSPHNNSGSVGVSSYDNLFATLIEHGYSQPVSFQAQSFLNLWACGQNIQEKASKAKIYRYRRIILDFVGVDILTKMDITFASIRVETVKMQQLEVPTWYQQAAA